MGPLAFARTPLLTRGGKLRLLAEPFVRGGDPSGESVAEFAARRFGREARDALIAPFLTGVYAGDETSARRRSGVPESGRRRTAQRLDRARPAGAGVSRGSRRGARERGPARRGSRRSPTPSPRRSATRCGCPRGLPAIGFEDGGYRVEIETESGAQTLRARALVLALPAQPASRLLGALDAEAAKAVGSIESAPVASVALSVASDATRVPVRGFGYLVPRGEGEVLLGCLFMSQLFAGRAPAGRELLTLLAAGRRKPAAIDWSDDQLIAALLAEVDAVLGLREAPRVLSITRWPRAVAQPGRDHPRLVAGVRARLARFPRLALAGAHLDGVAFGEALASGARAAQHVMEER